MSPAIVPSSFSGCGMNGMALLFAIMLIPPDLDDVRASGIGDMNAEAPATSPAKAAMAPFMFL